MHIWPIIWSLSYLNILTVLFQVQFFSFCIFILYNEKHSE